MWSLPTEANNDILKSNLPATIGEIVCISNSNHNVCVAGCLCATLSKEKELLSSRIVGSI